MSVVCPVGKEDDAKFTFNKTNGNTNANETRMIPKAKNPFNKSVVRPSTVSIRLNLAPELLELLSLVFRLLGMVRGSIPGAP